MRPMAAARAVKGDAIVMRRSLRFRSVVGASAIVLTAGLAFGATGMASDVFADGAPSGVSSATVPSQANGPVAPSASVGAKKLTLLGTYVETGNGNGMSVPAGAETTLDPVNKLTCPSGQTCTITDTIDVQLAAANSSAENKFGFPWHLDGFDTPDTPYVGLTPANGDLVSGSWSGNQTGISAGKHTVQSLVFSLEGAKLFAWTVTYSIYD
jgi:hypothetical protein